MNPSNALNREFFLQNPTLDHVFATFPSLVQGDDIPIINAQWRLLHEVELDEEIVEEEIVDTFWAKISEIVIDTESDIPAFSKLCRLTENLSLIQNSNASAERVWSKSGLIKIKRRNRLSFKNWRAAMLSSQLITDMVCYIKKL